MKRSSGSSPQESGFLPRARQRAALVVLAGPFMHRKKWVCEKRRRIMGKGKGMVHLLWRQIKLVFLQNLCVFLKKGNASANTENLRIRRRLNTQHQVSGVCDVCRDITLPKGKVCAFSVLSVKIGLKK